MPCSVCDREARSLGFCEKHYIRFRKYGDPHGGKRNHGTLAERFWPKVEKAGADECWEWTASRSATGYGFISGGKSRQTAAHRVSYELAYGSLPDGKCVMHTCDNRGCVNPAHLRCGSAQENIQDAYDKRRKVSPFVHAKNRYQGPRARQPGSLNANSKLTEQDIRDIRVSTDKPGILASKYGIIPDYVTKIRKRQAWTHVE